MATMPICNPHICRVLLVTVGYCRVLWGTVGCCGVLWGTAVHTAVLQLSYRELFISLNIPGKDLTGSLGGENTEEKLLVLI